MKNASAIIKTFTLLLILGGCVYSAPSELVKFEEAVKNKIVWDLALQKRRHYIYCVDLERKVDYELSLYGMTFPGNTKDLVNQCVNVAAWNSPAKKGLMWLKPIDKKEFNPPGELTFGSSIPNVGPFDDFHHGLSIKLQYLSNFTYRKTKEEEWNVLSFDYNVTGANGRVNVSREKGKVFVFISKQNDKMIEIYTSNGEWEYVRYLEAGNFPKFENPEDPVKIIEVIGNIWFAKVAPIIDRNNFLISSEK